MHLTLHHPRIEQTLHQRMKEYINLFVNSTQYASEDEAKGRCFGVFGGNEVELYGNAALMFEDVALRFGHKGEIKMPSMSLEVGIRPRIE